MDHSDWATLVPVGIRYRILRAKWTYQTAMEAILLEIAVVTAAIVVGVLTALDQHISWWSAFKGGLVGAAAALLVIVLFFWTIAPAQLHKRQAKAIEQFKKEKGTQATYSQVGRLLATMPPFASPTEILMTEDRTIQWFRWAEDTLGELRKIAPDWADRFGPCGYDADEYVWIRPPRAVPFKDLPKSCVRAFESDANNKSSCLKDLMEWTKSRG
jgi:hypothetical protein